MVFSRLSRVSRAGDDRGDSGMGKRELQRRGSQGHAVPLADRAHASRPIDYFGGSATVHVRSGLVPRHQPSSGKWRCRDRPDTAFLAERQDPTKRASFEQGVSARDHEEVEVDQVGNALAQSFVGSVFPTVGIPCFQVATASDGSNTPFGAQCLQRDRATAAVRRQLGQVVLHAFGRLIAVVEVMNGERVYGRRAEPLQRIPVLLHDAVVGVFEPEAKAGVGVPRCAFRPAGRLAAGGCVLYRLRHERFADLGIDPILVSFRYAGKCQPQATLRAPQAIKGRRVVETDPGLPGCGHRFEARFVRDPPHAYRAAAEAEGRDLQTAFSYGALFCDVHQSIQ